jgi:hypothetical protein
MAVQSAVELEHPLREHISLNCGSNHKSGRKRTEPKCGDDGG